MEYITPMRYPIISTGALEQASSGRYVADENRTQNILSRAEREREKERERERERYKSRNSIVGQPHIYIHVIIIYTVLVTKLESTP